MAKTAIQRIWQTAAAAPDATALRSGGRTIAYGQLCAAAGKLADKLVALGVRKDMPVGICLPRSFDYVIAMLAVCRAGGAFLPLDTAWPLERLRFILDDAGVAVVIAPADGRAEFAAENRIVLTPEDIEPASNDPIQAGEEQIDPADLAYVIYTSGSTGTPKGVEVTHANLRNLIEWHLEAFGVTERDRASCVAGLGFDAAVWEIWPYLCAGACISFPDEDIRASSDALQQWLTDEKITIAFVPTPLAEAMIARTWPQNVALRYLLTGGDTLHRAPAPGLPFTVVNNYGPTECTVVATSAGVPADNPFGGMPCLGRAISGTRIHILDESGLPAACGKVGEIYIGGAGVARGYRNRPDLTAERFIPDPFSDEAGGCLYRTGDLGHMRADGQIVFHGRTDTQVKIRGQRVELDEISAILNSHPTIMQSAAALHDGTQLTAYIVPKADERPSANELREFLGTRLPQYMIPLRFVVIESLPLSANGKLDRTALPRPDSENTLSEGPAAEPTTVIEGRLAEIMAELLEVDCVGVNDNFFLLGGHSLLGTQLVLKAHDAFGTELGLRDLFETQTVAKLASRIEARMIARLERMSDEETRRLLAG